MASDRRPKFLKASSREKSDAPQGKRVCRRGRPPVAPATAGRNPTWPSRDGPHQENPRLRPHVSGNARVRPQPGSRWTAGAAWLPPPYSREPCADKLCRFARLTACRRHQVVLFLFQASGKSSLLTSRPAPVGARSCSRLAAPGELEACASSGPFRTCRSATYSVGCTGARRVCRLPRMITTTFYGLFTGPMLTASDHGFS